jgi:hypothetical protein
VFRREESGPIDSSMAAGMLTQSLPVEYKVISFNKAAGTLEGTECDYLSLCAQ